MHRAGKAWVEYEQNMINMEEEIACKFDAICISSQGLGGAILVYLFVPVSCLEFVWAKYLVTQS